MVGGANELLMYTGVIELEWQAAVVVRIDGFVIVHVVQYIKDAVCSKDRHSIRGGFGLWEYLSYSGQLLEHLFDVWEI